ncbi:MAG TPA: hypothetical protein VH599_16315 [Ktedonobacterales bacterium]|jgi:hypothetical protein
MRVSKACWLSFGDWLKGGAPGTLPATLRLTLGPVWRLVPLARQSGEAVGPWLLSLLEARQRAGLALPADRELIEHDLQARPLTLAEAGREPSWAVWRLQAELLRLVRLVEAPVSLLYRSGWPQWEVRYWALVITLARITQLYAVLARQPGADPAERLLASAELVWQRALQAEPLVA